MVHLVGLYYKNIHGPLNVKERNMYNNKNIVVK